MKQDTSIRQLGAWLMILVAIIVGIWLLTSGRLGLRSTQGHHSQSSFVKENQENLIQINSHLKKADIEQQLKQLRRARENSALLNNSHQPPPHPSPSSSAFYMSPEDKSESVFEQLREREYPSPLNQRPADRVSERLEKRQWSDSYQQQYEKEYVDSFIRKARQAGWEVQLNDNLDVVDVQKIYEKEPMRFPQSGSGGSR